jgi:DNA repair protein SbcC/Rad50
VGCGKLKFLMIPKLLTLQNFLSYRDVTLDFSGLHVACVCGPNGAGKSSLLEAIAWCVWGQSRVSADDDIIRQGASEARVSFCFEHNQQTYRIIRSRRRNQSSSLEFQIQTDSQEWVASEAPQSSSHMTAEAVSGGSVADWRQGPTVDAVDGAAKQFTSQLTLEQATLEPTDRNQSNCQQTSRRPDLGQPDSAQLDPAQPDLEQANLATAEVPLLEGEFLAGKRFKSITQKGVRATQQYILAQLNIDYETFVNAAYLRQGRADEFMLKRPSDRKQVLADLLKLSHYDVLAEQAKEQSRQYKAQVQPLEALLDRLRAQLASREGILASYKQLSEAVEAQQRQQQLAQQQLNELTQQQQQRSQWQQQLALGRQQQQLARTTLASQQADLTSAQRQLEKTEAILAQAESIERHWAKLGDLRSKDEHLAARFQAYQEAQSERLQLQQQLGLQQQQQHAKIAQVIGQLAQLKSQAQDLEQVVSRKSAIAQKLEQLQAARKQLQQLDKMEAESAPVRQRLVQIDQQIGQAHTRLLTRIEEIGSRQAQMSQEHTQSPQLIKAAVEVSHRIAYLEQRRVYQEALRQKGLERRSFMERLQANQLNHEVELARFDQTLRLLEDPDDACCPICRQALGAQQWQELRDRTLSERDEVQNQIWAIREQLAVSESEIQVLRQEYRVLETELAKYSYILEERGQLKAKLASAGSLQDRLQAMSAERAQLERCLQENDYAENLQDEKQRLQAQLGSIEYDDRNHALVRSQVERLRWSEVKFAEVKQAEQRLAQIHSQRPQLEDELRQLQQALVEGEHQEAQQTLAALEKRLADLDYRLSDHNQVRAQLKQAQVWESRYQALQQARQVKAEQVASVAQLKELVARQQLAVTDIDGSLKALEAQLAAIADVPIDRAQIEATLAAAQQARDRQLAQMGRLQQQLSQLEQVQSQYAQQQEALAAIRHKHQVYKALAEAFGRNGIQALMIENLLPQLEAEANQILGRLSDHQLHVRFVTQRTGRQSKKVIDTLDILIADARGTRPYETYSGGEAFRVNFAIRLAIARLLAMRSGTALKMLVVDEGFATQDTEGCDRLIAAIEAIAPDFACILTITHMPQFREAFQTRIDVYKDAEGSHLTITA